MARIRNINEKFGDALDFGSVEEMAQCIADCGYSLPEDGLVDGRDYEHVVDITPVEDRAALLCIYDKQCNPQPVYVYLDEDGHMYADYDHDIGGGVPTDIWYGCTQRYGIPILHAAGANALMERIRPLANRVFAGLSVEWSGSDWIGHMDDDASAADDEIRRICIDDIPSDAYLQWQCCGDYIAAALRRTDTSVEIDGVCTITAETTDEEIAEIAKKIESAADDDVGLYLLDTVECLTAERDSLEG
jgi:hypothetical protein